MKKVISTLMFLALIPLSSYTLSMPSMPKFGAKPEPESEAKEPAASASDSQDALVAQFKDTLSSILLAQKYLAIAFDQADQASQLDAEMTSLEGDCGKDCLARATKVSVDANKSIGKKLDAQAEISAEGKANYLLAIPPYIKGTLSAKDLATAAADWGKQATGEIKSAGMMNAPKLKKKLDSGMYVAQQTPKLIKNWATATKQLATYAKASDIDLGSVEGASDFDFGD